MARSSNICPHVLDLIRILMKTNRQQYRLLGAYVFRDGDLAAAEKDAASPVPRPALAPSEDDCPPGYHQENGVCVPD
jgi:hypothetical protein